MYILLLHTQVIGLGTLGLVYTLSTEALPRMEATRGKVKTWRVDSLRSGDLEEVNSKAMSISCDEQLRFQVPIQALSSPSGARRCDAAQLSERGAWVRACGRPIR